MSLDEEVLEAVARGGSMDYDKWPAMVEPLLERLEYIVFNAFPMPKIPPESASSSFPSSSQQMPDPIALPSSSNKENASPADLQTPPRPTAPPVPPFSPSSERVPDSQPQSFVGSSNDTLPPPLTLLFNSIKSTLRSFFASKPPHTIQRLAELILRPNAHYRTLPAYLRAVDRVVVVTSTADIFPLQVQPEPGQPNGLVNGSGFLMADNNLGSDESLGGALLTPIPWLSNASIDHAGAGPAAEGLVSDPTALDETVKQQQLQQGADPGAATQQSSISTTEDSATVTSSPPADASEEVPHARGPPVVGVEDMGLQNGQGVEMELSNPETAPVSHLDGHHSTEGDSEHSAPQGDADGDGDIVLGDAKAGGEEQNSAKASAGEGRETKTENSAV